MKLINYFRGSRSIFFFVFILAAPQVFVVAQDLTEAEPICSQTGIAEIARRALAQSTKGTNIPGVTVAVYMPTRFSRPISIASGWSDFALKRPITVDSKILAGSIGKTFYTAAALRLVDQGKLDLEKTVAFYLPKENIPSSDKVTVRMLLSHRSGYGEYDGVFMEGLIKDPTRIRTLDDWIGPLRRNPMIDIGAFRYSDINFVILAHIIDQVAKTSATEFIRTQFLLPYHLDHTAAADQREIAGLVQGYAGPKNFFGRDNMIEAGKLLYNPQFESGGGGYVSTAPDLAKWITLFSTSTLFSPARWKEASAAVSPDPKTGNAYGFGIHIDQTSQGVAYGHSGYIPGYVSWARWYEKPLIAVAIQTNTSDDARFDWDGFDVSDRIVANINRACTH